MGTHRLIEPPSRLVFTWISAGTDREETLVTVEFAEAGSVTRLTLIHERLPASKVAMHSGGWTMIVDRLAALLAACG